MTLILVFTDDTQCLLSLMLGLTDDTHSYMHSKMTDTYALTRSYISIILTAHSQLTLILSDVFPLLMVNTSAKRDNCACISKLYVIICLLAIIKVIVSIIYLVTPAKVTNPTSYRKDTGIIHTAWVFSMDTGSCAVQYEIRFLDVDNNIVYTQDKIAKQEYIKRFTSTNQRDSVKSIKVTATYSGQLGCWSEATVAATKEFHGKS